MATGYGEHMTRPTEHKSGQEHGGFSRTFEHDFREAVEDVEKKTKTLLKDNTDSHKSVLAAAVKHLEEMHTRAHSEEGGPGPQSQVQLVKHCKQAVEDAKKAMAQ